MGAWGSLELVLSDNVWYTNCPQLTTNTKNGNEPLAVDH